MACLSALLWIVVRCMLLIEGVVGRFFPLRKKSLFVLQMSTNGTKVVGGARQQQHEHGTKVVAGVRQQQL